MTVTASCQSVAVIAVGIVIVSKIVIAVEIAVGMVDAVIENRRRDTRAGIIFPDTVDIDVDPGGKVLQMPEVCAAKLWYRSRFGDDVVRGQHHRIVVIRQVKRLRRDRTVREKQARSVHSYPVRSGPVRQLPLSTVRT